jgi:hypothetical protein
MLIADKTVLLTGMMRNSSTARRKAAKDYGENEKQCSRLKE